MIRRVVTAYLVEIQKALHAKFKISPNTSLKTKKVPISTWRWVS